MNKLSISLIASVGLFVIVIVMIFLAFDIQNDIHAQVMKAKELPQNSGGKSLEVIIPVPQAILYSCVQFYQNAAGAFEQGNVPSPPICQVNVSSPGHCITCLAPNGRCFDNRFVPQSMLATFSRNLNECRKLGQLIISPTFGSCPHPGLGDTSAQEYSDYGLIGRAVSQTNTLPSNIPDTGQLASRFRIDAQDCREAAEAFGKKLKESPKTKEY